jgi:hypothetical protein
MRRRKVTGIRRRRKGDNSRMARGDDAMRTRRGMETAKTATSTTDVVLRVCIIAGALSLSRVPHASCPP